MNRRAIGLFMDGRRGRRGESAARGAANPSVHKKEFEAAKTIDNLAPRRRP